MKKDYKKISQEFISAIRFEIMSISNTSTHSDETAKDKLELLAFNILVMLDGHSGSFSHSINELNKSTILLHEQFHEKVQ